MDLLHLPSEMLYLIIDEIESFEDYFALGRVCHELRDICTDEDVFAQKKSRVDTGVLDRQLFMSKLTLNSMNYVQLASRVYFLRLLKRTYYPDDYFKCMSDDDGRKTRTFKVDERFPSQFPLETKKLVRIYDFVDGGAKYDLERHRYLATTQMFYVTPHFNVVPVFGLTETKHGVISPHWELGTLWQLIESKSDLYKPVGGSNECLEFQFTLMEDVLAGMQHILDKMGLTMARFNEYVPIAQYNVCMRLVDGRLRAAIGNYGAQIQAYLSHVEPSDGQDRPRSELRYSPSCALRCMSREQIRERQYGARGLVYQMGMIFHVILYGELPWPELEDIQAATRVALPARDNRFDAFIAKSCAEFEEDRFASLTEMSEALTQLKDQLLLNL